MQKSLGVTVIVEAVPGAAGSIGAGRVARAAPDGYTLSVGPGMSTHVINGAIYDLSYDVLKDFTPIALISFLHQIILAKKEMPADDLADPYLRVTGVKVFVDMKSHELLTGTTIDFVVALEGSGFTFDNPNAKSSCSCGKSFG